jgi:pimeloyl-ACP methyl ester carboxylesterase
MPYATVNGIRLAYTDQGTGLPLVFLHGFPLNREMWTPQVQGLGDQARTITVDLRGHGESEAPLWQYTMEQFADDVAGLLDHLGLQQVVLVGLSMGGYVALTFFRRHAHRLKALILTDTRAQADTDEGRAGRFHMAQTAYRKGPAAIREIMVPKLLCPMTLQSNRAVVSRVETMITQMEVSGLAGDLMAMAGRPDSIPLLPSIHCPTLVIVGAQDQATPVSDARLMAELIPNARLETIADAGHLPNLEQPGLFNQAMKRFLATLI